MSIPTGNNPPTDPSAYGPVGSGTDDTGAAAAASAQISIDAPDDTSSSSTTISDQISAADQDSGGGSSIPNDPGVPTLKRPPDNFSTTLATTTSTSSQGTSSSPAGNPWFAPNAAMAFNAIMSQVLGLQKTEQFLEGKLGIQENQLAYSLAKDNAADVLADAKNQAAQKLMDAMSNFLQAGLGAMSALQTAKAGVTATKEYNTGLTEREDGLTQDQNMLTMDARSRLPPAGTAGDSANVNTTTEGELKPLTPQEKADFEAKTGVSLPLPTRDQNLLKAKVDKESQELDAYVKNKYSYISNKTQEITTAANNVNQILTHGIQGVTSILQAGLIEQDGQINANKTITQGQQDYLNNVISNTSNYRQGFQQDFQSALDFINKYMDAEFKAFDIKG